MEVSNLLEADVETNENQHIYAQPIYFHLWNFPKCEIK